MTAEPREFARMVLDAFREAGHYTDREVGDAGGPSTTFMTNLRKVAESDAGMPEPRGDTFKRIDRAASWATGSARALWRDRAVPVRVANSPLRDVLGLPEESPAAQRERRRRSMATGGLDRYVEGLADRLLELEERVDQLEFDLGRDAGDADLRQAARRSARRPPRGPQTTDE